MKSKLKFIIPGIAIVVGLVVGGAFLFGSDSPPPANASDTTNPVTDAPANGGTTPTPPTPPTQSYAPGFGEGNSMQVHPPEVSIGNYAPGREASYDIQIYNGKDEPRTYNIEYRVSERRRPDYEAPPGNAGQWVIFTPSTLTINPKQIGSVTVTLRIPEGTTVDVPQWEFLVYVVEATGAEFEVEIGTRWLVRMA